MASRRTVSPPFVRSYPPRRVPSRSARQSVSVSPPKVPPHRAQKNRREISVSSTSAQNSLANVPLVPNGRKVRNASYCPGVNNNNVDGAHGESPYPRSPVNAAAWALEKKQNASHTAMMQDANDELPHHYYRLSEGEENDAELVGYGVYSRKAGSSNDGDSIHESEQQRNTYRYKNENIKRSVEHMGNPYEENREFAPSARGDGVVVGDGGAHDQHTIVTGVVDVIPCRWRFELTPNAEPVEVQIENINTSTYKAQKLLQLIEQALPFGANDLSTRQGPTPLTPTKGSLLIYRKDNAHVPFQRSVPKAVVLKGATVLDDIIDTKRIPIEGTKIFLRWIEDTPEPVAENSSAIDSRSNLIRKNSLNGGKKENTRSVERIGCVQSSIGSVRGNPCELPKAYKSSSRVSSSEESNGYRGHRTSMRRGAQDNQEINGNSTTAKASGREHAVEPITYLHVPCVLYKNRLGGS